MIIEREFSFEERVDMANLLSEHHSVFQTFWTIGKPLFTHSIKTAAVGFDRHGQVVYLILNPDFWDSLDLYNKSFVIAHECLHVILNHGKRGNEYQNQKNVNIAQDIVINEMLVNGFGFNKFQIDNWKNYCFVGTVFSNQDIIDNQIHTRGSFHYYLDLIDQTKTDSQQSTMDQHASGGDLGELDPFIQDYIDQATEFGTEAAQAVKEEIDHVLNDREKHELAQKMSEEIKDAKNRTAGTVPLGDYISINPNPPKKKKKWEEIVKKHLRSVLKYETVQKPSWISRDRRHACLSEELMAQGQWNHEVPVKSKYKIIFFLDSSGSCLSYAKRFVQMLQSIPDDTFDIEAYAFDYNLYPIDLKTGHVRGGGGTSFTILDEKIRDITKKKRHPDAIFILSDGDGNPFKPEKPNLWHWILTPHHNTRLIPKESPKHDMKNFE